MKFQNEYGVSSTRVVGPAQLHITIFGPVGQTLSPQQTSNT